MSKHRTRPAQECTACAGRVHGQVICNKCAGRLGDWLTEIRDLLDGLFALRSASDGRVGGKSAQHPLPFDVNLAQTAHDVKRVLAGWVYQIATSKDLDELGGPLDERGMCQWLHARVRFRIVHYPAAGEFYVDAHGLVVKLIAAVDTRPDRWFAGPCDTPGCVEPDPADENHVRMRPTELFADTGAKTIRCRRCKQPYDVEERRQHLLRLAEDHLGTAAEIGRAANVFGVDITPAAVYGYVQRKRLVPKGFRPWTNSKGELEQQPLYRVGDVIELAQEAAARRAGKQARSA